MNVIYEDDSLIVVEKPAGVESQEVRGLAKDMVSEIKKHLKKNNAKDLYVGVIHRLDKPVRGIMVYAKTKQAAANLSQQMAKAGHMDKEYLAVCEGVPTASHINITDFLLFDKKTNFTSVVSKNEPEAKCSELELELLDTFSLNEGSTHQLSALFEKQLNTLKSTLNTFDATKKLSLVRVKLKTGRHHQIRVQLSHAGLPILGDTKYNPDFNDYRGNSALCLCSVSLSFIHPVTKQCVCFTLEKKMSS